MKGKPSDPLTWLRIPSGQEYEPWCTGSFILLSYILLYGNKQGKKNKSKLMIFVMETMEVGAEYSFMPGVNFFHLNLQSNTTKNMYCLWKKVALLSSLYFFFTSKASAFWSHLHNLATLWTCLLVFADCQPIPSALWILKNSNIYMGQNCSL